LESLPTTFRGPHVAHHCSPPSPGLRHDDDSPHRQRRRRRHRRREGPHRKIHPVPAALDIAANRAWWDANITGDDADFKRKEEAQNQIDAVLSDPKAFAEVKAIKEKGGIDDPTLKRAIDVIYLIYLEKQVDPELLKKMTALSNEVEKKFSNFRAKVDGVTYDDAKIRNVLKTSKLTEKRKEVYEASKEVGKLSRRTWPSLSSCATKPHQSSASPTTTPCSSSSMSKTAPTSSSSSISSTP